MEITRHQEGAVLELRVAGRLDAYWADHLQNEVQEAIRGGAHQLQLDFSGVTFLSSAGLRVLLTGYQQLSAIQGSLTVIRPAPGVQQVLELAGFDELLVAQETTADRRPPTAPVERGTASYLAERPADRPHIEAIGGRSAAVVPTLDRETARFEIFPLSPGATLRCRLVGEFEGPSEPADGAAPPERLSGGDFRLEECHPIAFPDGSFGIGVGAPGSSLDECRERFGEFLAVAGSAAYLPTDGTNVPDYLASAGSFVPELHVLHGLKCEGTFALMSRFEAKEEPGRVTLSQLVDACLEVAGAPAAGIVIVAQSAGLVGAALRRSPGSQLPAPGSRLQAGTDPSTPSSELRAPSGSEATWLPGFPEIRQWLSFTPERAHTRSLVLLAGVAARESPEHPPASGVAGEITRKAQGATHKAGSGVAPAGHCALRLAPWLRPLASDGHLAGHFHAAAFSYRPLQRGELDLKTTVGTLFDVQTLQGVLHLLNDDRPIAGAGESEFVRGACWVSPIINL